jgi:hypothetical protein
LHINYNTFFFSCAFDDFTAKNMSRKMHNKPDRNMIEQILNQEITRIGRISNPRLQVPKEIKRAFLVAFDCLT